MLISLAPYHVSRYFHRISSDQATDSLIYLANHKGKIQSIDSIWPSMTNEELTILQLMEKTSKVTRARKHRRRKGKNGTDTVVEIQQARKDKKGKKSKNTK